MDDSYNDIMRDTLKPIHLTDVVIRAFILKYVQCRDLGQSAKEVEITLKDAKFLYNKPDIFKCIESITSEAVVKYGYDAAEVVERTKELAFFDPIDLVNEDGTYKKNLRDIPPEARRVIKKMVVKNSYLPDANGIHQYSGEVITYEFWDKPRSLELLGREKDTFKKTTVVQHDVSKNAREFLLDSMRRADDVIDVTPGLPKIEHVPHKEYVPIQPVSKPKITLPKVVK